MIHIKISLITTKGCVACKIMTKLTVDAVKHLRKHRRVSSVDCKLIDSKDIPKWVINVCEVNDFPLLLIRCNNEYKGKIEGSCTCQSIINKVVECCNLDTV